ncbi:MAG: hypothetical protein N2Z79_00940, partial [Candidatus Omnitrophica bacterium]|nr:hypothetical protein [Candidatus Omnitrophota bacterium]
MPKVGLIAGNRKFPLLVAQEAKKRHYEVIAIGIRKDTLPFLEKIVDKIYWLNLADFEKIFEIFKKENIEEIIFAGQITPKRIFSREVQRSGALREFLDNIPDKRPTNIFGKIAKELEDRGFRVLDSTVFLKEHLPAKGVLTEIIPDFPAWEDIYFGLDVARGISFLDVG